jgi:hypothetical protein
MEAQVEAANRQTGASLTLRSTESSALISGALAGKVTYTTHMLYNWWNAQISTVPDKCTSVGIASSTCADIQSSCTWLAVENVIVTLERY